MSKPRVLFVDDEPRILDGLRRSLRNMRREWDMSFAPGGEAALGLLEESPVDVVISDMRMPGMDGAELLTQVSQRYPEIARTVLSGHTEPEAAIRVAVSGHRFLTKPTDVDNLVEVIQALTQYTSAGSTVEARRIAGSIRSLPPPPEHAELLRDLLRPGDTEVSRTAQAVTLDVGLIAKLLQLSNSAFFGARPRNASVEAVVNAVGVPTIDALVAASHNQWASVVWEPQTADWLRHSWRHAVATACLVNAIASPAHRPHAEAAALLQDIGPLACAAARGGSAAVPGCASPDLPGGVSPREVGVELLHLWGLPSAISAAVAGRDTPQEPSPAGLGVAGALRVAHLLIQQTDSRDPADGLHDDELTELLAHPQLCARSTDWHQAADEASARAARWLEP